MNDTKVRPGSERWLQLVMLGIMKDATRNWFLGDAALEIAPARWDILADGTSSPAFYPGEEALLHLHRYADEIGVDHNRLSVYRQVAAYWPKLTRQPDTCWKTHQMLVRQQDLMRPKMTVTQAHEALGHSTLGRGGALAEQRREQEDRELADSDRVQKVRREAAETNPLDERERRNDLAPRIEWVASLLRGIRKEISSMPGLSPMQHRRIHAAALEVGLELVELVHTNGTGEISVQELEKEAV